MDIHTIPPFDIVGDATCVGPRWKRWRRSFEFYVVAKGVTTEVQKKALLLHTAGVAVQDIFENLTDPGPLGGGEDGGSVYEVAMRTLDSHFSPKLNTPYERHVFRQMKQETGETVDQFVARLRQQAGNCEFGAQLEENIRDQMLLVEDSDNYDAYSAAEREEFLFQLFRHICLGGALCQYEDNVEPYLEITKLVYKDLVSVQKDSKTGKLLVTSIVFKITASDEHGVIYPDHEAHEQNFAYLIVDPLKRQVNVLYHKFGTSTYDD